MEWIQRASKAKVHPDNQTNCMGDIKGNRKRKRGRRRTNRTRSRENGRQHLPLPFSLHLISFSQIFFSLLYPSFISFGWLYPSCLLTFHDWLRLLSCPVLVWLQSSCSQTRSWTINSWSRQQNKANRKFRRWSARCTTIRAAKSRGNMSRETKVKLENKDSFQHQQRVASSSFYFLRFLIPRKVRMSSTKPEEEGCRGDKEGGKEWNELVFFSREKIEEKKKTTSTTSTSTGCDVKNW